MKWDRPMMVKLAYALMVVATLALQAGAGAKWW